MPVIASAATALPEHRYVQGEITEAFADLIIHDAGASPQTRDVIRRTHEATTVEARHLVLTLPEYEPLDNLAKPTMLFLPRGTAAGGSGGSGSPRWRWLPLDQVDVIASTTVTGVAVPSIDARLVPLLGPRSDVRRLPLMGLGCVAGASGLARVSEVLAGDPDAVAVLVSVELCSLTLQHDDVSMANIVASGLFGDGAAAVVVVGDRRAEEMGIKGPKVLGSHAHFFADTERVMGWDVGSSGLRVVLSPEVPGLVAAEMAVVTNTLLRAHGLGLADVSTGR